MSSVYDAPPKRKNKSESSKAEGKKEKVSLFEGEELMIASEKRR
jgi:hypothetical protein